MSAWDLLLRGDALTSAVAMGLLLMSVASWLVIVWKAWMLQAALGDTARSIAAFWQADSFEGALSALRAMDREALLLPVVRGGPCTNGGCFGQCGGPLAATHPRDARRLAPCAAQAAIRLGTVGHRGFGGTFCWALGYGLGYFHALIGISGAGAMTIEQISGPVGEALIMTAAGLAVAIPAVIGYNILGRLVARIESDLDGFARGFAGLAPRASAAAAGGGSGMSPSTDDPFGRLARSPRRSPHE